MPVRILHTADWHVGKRLGRFDRIAEHRAALDEVAAVAERERVDLVVVAGDLFDRPAPPIEALQVVINALLALATPARPVVAIAGNHDSADLFEVLAPLLAPKNVHLVGEIRRPDAGGVLALPVGDSGATNVHVACLPFLREGRAVDFLADVDSWYGQYADTIAKLCRAYNAELAKRARDDPDAVTVLTAHFIVSGVRLGGGGAPRGERQLHIGEAYTATEHAIPPDVQYVALGHVHAPQPVPGAAVAATYAGSLLELDFGEAGEQKRVAIVDLEAGVPASVRSVPIGAGRKLRRAHGRFDALLAQRDALADCYLDLTVETDGPDPGLADRARAEFPYLARVRVDYAREDAGDALSRSLPWDALYADYHQRAHGVAAEPEMMALFRQVLDEASR